MVFVVGKDGKLRLEPCAKSHEISRMTPYEFVLTAEPCQQTVTCVRSVDVPPSSISMTVRTEIRAFPTSLIGLADRVA